MKALVIGASGQVGRRLMNLLPGAVGTGFTNAQGLMRLNLADADSVSANIAELRPDVIFVPGGVTAVDWCESHRAEAERICVDGSRAVQAMARRLRAFVIHFSTDYLFAGGDGPYREDAVPRPLNTYGQIKLAAERAVVEAGGALAIVRTSMVYSHDPGGKNFAQFVRDGLAAGREVKAFTDQSGSPTYAPALARAVVEIAERRLEGVWNVAGPDVLTRHDFALRVARAFALPTDTLKAVTSADLPLPAKRPGLRAGLDVGKAQSELKSPMTGLADAVSDMKLQRL
jgi:dTDP-4-dehydrorhamnose reductase